MIRTSMVLRQLSAGPIGGDDYEYIVEAISKDSSEDATPADGKIEPDQNREGRAEEQLFMATMTAVGLTSEIRCT
jgi:hypothetical protein